MHKSGVLYTGVAQMSKKGTPRGRAAVVSHSIKVVGHWRSRSQLESIFIGPMVVVVMVVVVVVAAVVVVVV